MKAISLHHTLQRNFFMYYSTNGNFQYDLATIIYKEICAFEIAWCVNINTLAM